MNNKLSNIFILAILITYTVSIYLPLTPKRPRCMMVYTIGDIQSVKIELGLIPLPSQGSDEYYLFTMRNTETEETKMDQTPSGTYKKEYDLTPNVIYQYCIQLNTERTFENITILYNAETVYNIDHSEMKVPQNLLKKDDFKGTYEAAFKIGETVKSYSSMQKDRDEFSNQNFEETTNVDKRLIIISVLEIVIIVAAGIYQYLSLQNYLTSKQYI